MSKVFRYSEINTAYSCLYKYKLLYLDKVESEQQSGDMQFGSAIHLAIQAHFEKEDPVQVFSMYWQSIKDKPLLYTRNKWEDLKDKGEVFIERWLRLHSKHYNPIAFEKRVAIELGGFKLEGTPDFIGEYKGIPSIVDFKTSSAEYAQKKIISNEQMYIYAKMAKDVYNYDVKQLVYTVFIKNPEPRIQTLTFELTESKMQSMLDNVVLMMQDLSNRDKFPKNRNSCGYCEFFERCYK